jgi:hypothetical protein
MGSYTWEMPATLRSIQLKIWLTFQIFIQMILSSNIDATVYSVECYATTSGVTHVRTVRCCWWWKDFQFIRRFDFGSDDESNDAVAFVGHFPTVISIGHHPTTKAKNIDPFVVAQNKNFWLCQLSTHSTPKLTTPNPFFPYLL